MSVRSSRSARAKVPVRLKRFVSLAAMAFATTALLPNTVVAKTIHKTVSIKLSLSATSAPDGTLTLDGAYTSPNPRCLTRQAFDSQLRRGDHVFVAIGSGLFYGNVPQGASPPHGGWLSPVSPFGHSPFRWQLVAPGDAGTYIGTYPYGHASTVAAATRVIIWGHMPARSWGDSGPYEVTYQQGGNKVELTCIPDLKNPRKSFSI